MPHPCTSHMARALREMKRPNPCRCSVLHTGNHEAKKLAAQVFCNRSSVWFISFGMGPSGESIVCLSLNVTRAYLGQYLITQHLAASVLDQHAAQSLCSRNVAVSSDRHLCPHSRPFLFGCYWFCCYGSSGSSRMHPRSPGKSCFLSTPVLISFETVTYTVFLCLPCLSASM
jgi:hypothetical protein